MNPPPLPLFPAYFFFKESFPNQFSVDVSAFNTNCIHISMLSLHALQSLSEPFFVNLKRKQLMWLLPTACILYMAF